MAEDERCLYLEKFYKNHGHEKTANYFRLLNKITKSYDQICDQYSELGELFHDINHEIDDELYANHYIRDDRGNNLQFNSPDDFEFFWIERSSNPIKTRLNDLFRGIDCTLLCDKFSLDVPQDLKEILFDGLMYY